MPGSGTTVGERLSGPVMGCAIAALTVFATAYAGVAFTRGAGAIAAIWGANAVWLVGMLTARPGRVAHVTAAGFGGNLAANLLTGESLTVGLALPVANLVEVLICFAALRRFGGHDLTHTRRLAFFAAIAAGPATVASGLLAASLFAAVGNAPFWTIFMGWYAADALGLITFTPLIASIAALRLEGAPSTRSIVEAGLAAAAFAVLLTLVFFQHTVPILFIVLPALVLIAFRFGFGGASLALVTTAVVAVAATANDYGPLSLIDVSFGGRVAVLQLFVAVSAVMSLHVAAALAERDRLTAELRAAKTETDSTNELLRLAEQVSQMGRWRFELDGGRISWSDAVFRMHGRDLAAGPPDLATAVAAYHPDDRADVAAILDEAIAAKTPFSFRKRIVREDGEPRTVVSRGLCELDAAGDVTALFGTILDMTDVARAEEALKASEARFRLLAENASELFILGHDDGRRSYISPASLRLLGFTPEELAAMRLKDYVHPEDFDRLRATTARLGAGEQEVSLVYRALNKTRGWISVEATFRRVADTHGDGPTIVATFRDVGERLAQAGVVERARAAAEEALAVKNEFVAMMSHELRTPLNSIVGFTSLLSRSGEVASLDGRKFMRNIQIACSGLLAIVNDVMDVSKIEAGAIELDAQAFDVAELCDTMADVVRAQADEKGIALTVSVDPALPARLVGDDQRLGQVLLNLLSNAVKFTEEGGVTLRASLDWSDASAASVRFSVSDTGIGIPEDKRDRLFRPFSQIDASTSRRFGGTGLGLSICKSLLEMMGGDINVESREGAGSTFSFSIALPIASASAEPAPGQSEADATVASRPLRILVAEDAPMNQELLAAMLAQWGHAADIVADGAAAVEAARQGDYDLVLMDIQMPGMDGVEATRRIRALGGPAAELPVVALTANVLPADAARFRAAGMLGPVSKPFAPKELAAAVERFAAARTPAEAEAADAAPHNDFEADKLETLEALVGRDAVASFLDRLKVQMDGCFAAPPATEADMARIRYEAHALASTSGMLGFKRLSDACIALETACRLQHASPGSIVPALADALAARAAASRSLERMLEEAREPA